jgi:hypothetical protein
METYLSRDLIRSSFLSLKETREGGKTGTECTTAIFIFLAFDALLKHSGLKEPVDLDPEEGKANRSFMAAQFSLCSTVGYNDQNSPWQVVTLGQVCQHKASAEKRIGSNFLTTRLKLSADAGETFIYPKRPKPLFLMGKSATGTPWGLQRHPDWKTNWPELFHDRVSRAPFRDLAIFLLRDKSLNVEEKFVDSLRGALSLRFTDQLCSLFQSRIAWEEKLWPLKVEPYQETPPKAFKDLSWVSPNAVVPPESNKVRELEERVGYLESLLTANNVKFRKDTPCLTQ